MGFPVGYTDFFLPKLLVHLFTFLGFVRNLISAVLAAVGLAGFLQPDTQLSTRTDFMSDPISVSAALILELLPVVMYSELIDPPDSCAVCLCEFDGGDEIRRLANCRHVFHRRCVDRWIDHDRKTCPLCRRTFVPEDMQGSFNERLWAATGNSDFYGDYSPITTGF